MQMTSQKAGTTSPYTNCMDLTYSYGAVAGQMGVGSTAGNAGQMTSISGTINGTTESASYTYDNYERLKSGNQTSNGSSANRTFVYDRWGNRTEVSQTGFGGGTQLQAVTLAQSGGVPTNRISSVTSNSTTVNYTYDSAGNVTSDGAHTYSYDSENRLMSVDGGTTASYVYDQQNRRYRATLGSSITHYIWEEGKVLAEHNGSTGAVVVNYIYAGSRMIARIASGTTSYILGDRLSARLTLDSSGAVTGRQAHLPFGEVFATSGTQQKQNFTSYERDSHSGTDYGVNRHYASLVGRFHSADPFQPSADATRPQSWNRYAYVMNAPIDSIDPLGLLRKEPEIGDPCSIFGGIPEIPNVREIADIVKKVAEIANFLTHGWLGVDPTCDKVIYKPEDPPKAPWERFRLDIMKVDAVATPRGVLKIPNGCVCVVLCGDKNYEILCISVTSIIPIVGRKPRLLDTGHEFSDPRDTENGDFDWVPSVPDYSVERSWAYPNPFWKFY